MHIFLDLKKRILKRDFFINIFEHRCKVFMTSVHMPEPVPILVFFCISKKFIYAIKVCYSMFFIKNGFCRVYRSVIRVPKRGLMFNGVWIYKRNLLHYCYNTVFNTECFANARWYIPYQIYMYLIFNIILYGWKSNSYTLFFMSDNYWLKVFIAFWSLTEY